MSSIPFYFGPSLFKLIATIFICEVLFLLYILIKFTIVLPSHLHEL